MDDSNNKHWHVLHLWAVCPGKKISLECRPELLKDTRQTLIYRGDAAKGWSLGLED
jgi:alpha-L-fucosidase 2